MPGAFRRLLRLDADLKPPSVDLHDPAEFFATLDNFQRDAFRRLRRFYSAPGNDAFCKLVALKTANALAADYHFRRRHSRLVSLPVQLQVDPTNACHMHCPSCLHSANAAWSSRFDWPKATLSRSEFDEFCNEFGPFATSVALFRDGEPLLHRGFPGLVSAAKGYLLYTVTSTSLSMPIDADALVASGLDRLAAAIDGGSTSTYAIYRRGGDFDLVTDNLRAIVRARRAQSSLKPWLVWQFLAFEHNVHEIEATAALAREIGVDQFVVAKPHSVEHDDPGIKVAEQAPFGETYFTGPRTWCAASERTSVERNAARIDSVFHHSWMDRFKATADLTPKSRPGDLTCNWLYYSLTMDAARRITPCCLPPMRSPEARHLVFATFSGKNTGETINSPGAIRARTDCRSGQESAADTPLPSPYCINCHENPPPPMLPDVAGYVVSVDERRALPVSVHTALAASPLFAWTP